MAVRPLVKQAIAKDQLEVASKLDDLLVQNNIDTDSIIDVEVTKFGTNQFLILAVYYGIYALWATAGLVSRVARLLGMSREGKVAAGLSLDLARQINLKRAASAQTGLSSQVSRAVDFSRVIPVDLGLLARVKQGFAKLSFSLGLSPELTRGVEKAPLKASIGLTPAWNGAARWADYLTKSKRVSVGLACDIGFVWTHP